MREYEKSGLEKEAESLDYSFVADLLAGRKLTESQKSARDMFCQQYDAATRLKGEKPNAVILEEKDDRIKRISKQ